MTQRFEYLFFGYHVISDGFICKFIQLRLIETRITKIRKTLRIQAFTVNQRLSSHESMNNIYLCRMKLQIDNKSFELMIEYDQIKKRARLIGIQLHVSYEQQHPVFLGVLNGSF